MSNRPRAFISVADKTGLVDFARDLTTVGLNIISTGNQTNHLAAHTISILPMSSHTGFLKLIDDFDWLSPFSPLRF